MKLNVDIFMPLIHCQNKKLKTGLYAVKSEYTIWDFTISYHTGIKYQFSGISIVNYPIDINNYKLWTIIWQLKSYVLNLLWNKNMNSYYTICNLPCSIWSSFLCIPIRIFISLPPSHVILPIIWQESFSRQNFFIFYQWFTEF